jgi:hypothetical protein
MDTKSATATSQPPAGVNGGVVKARRKRQIADDGTVRYFLPKPGSSPATPELGQEMTSEGEALIQAFKNGQPFYTLTAWKAVPEVNGGGSPMIVKQPVVRT